MEISKAINQLPLSKSNPTTLEALFGNINIEPMWVADMDFPIAKPIQEALQQRIIDAPFGYEYKPDSFVQAQKNWYEKNYGIQLDSRQTLYSPSISTSIAVLIEEYSNEGEGVIIQPPVFMEFREAIRKSKRRIIKNPLALQDGRYEIDFGDLAEKAQIEQNKILILCNPHNPVGRVWKKEELAQIISICEKHDLLLISDEIHKDIILHNNQFTSALHFADKYDKMVVCTSEAKTFNLCGIADSMAIIPNVEIKTALQRTLKKYNLGRTNALSRVALEAAYKNGQAWLTNLIQTIERNVASVEKEIKDSKIELIQAEGTYQLWLDFREVYDDSKEMFEQITRKSRIGLNAGHWFGREGALFMRMNIATSNEKVAKAIKKICIAVEKR